MASGVQAGAWTGSWDVPPEIARSCREFTTCDVSDVLLKLGVRSGGYLPDFVRRTGDGRCFGRVWPVQFADKDDAAACAVSPNYNGHYIDNVPAGAVVLLQAPKYLTNACLGGIMALRAQVCGAVGIIVDGRVRDVAELTSIQENKSMPVFSRGLSIVGAGAGCKPMAVNVQVQIEGYGAVHPGDIVFADDEGVVVIPKDTDPEDFYRRIVKGTEADGKVSVAVRGGMTVEKAFATFR
ncbi:hypothetical protein PYCC9005_002270 [Savitreella phatthalungensis]